MVVAAAALVALLAGAAGALSLSTAKSGALVGGEGTRLRPLTERWAKPVLPIDGDHVIKPVTAQVTGVGQAHTELPPRPARQLLDPAHAVPPDLRHLYLSAERAHAPFGRQRGEERLLPELLSVRRRVRQPRAVHWRDQRRRECRAGTRGAMGGNGRFGAYMWAPVANNVVAQPSETPPSGR